MLNYPQTIDPVSDQTLLEQFEELKDNVDAQNDKIQTNTTNIQANADAIANINITPEQVSQIQTNKDDISEIKTDITNLADTKANVSDIPTKTSELSNNSGFITESSLEPYAKKSELPTQINLYSEIGQNNDGALTQKATTNLLAAAKTSADLLYAKKTEIPTNTSQLNNNSDFITLNDIITKLESGNVIQNNSNKLTSGKYSLIVIANKFACLVLQDLFISGAVENFSNILTNLPKPPTNSIFYIFNYDGRNYKPMRIEITTDGNARWHWCDTPSALAYYGMICYEIA